MFESSMSASTGSESVLDRVLADLATEGDQLHGLVATLPEEQWRAPTPAPGWDVATSIAHLAWTDEVATAAATDNRAWDAIVAEAIADPTGFVDATALAGGRAPVDELLGRWRRSRSALAAALRGFPDGERLPWFGPPMSPVSMATARFMETWAHGLDVAEAVVPTGSTTEAGSTTGVPEPTDRIRHVAHLGVRTRDFAFRSNGLQPPAAEFRVSLTAPSGAVWEWGPADAEQSVTGPAYDFCLRVTQRRHRDDLALVAVGEDASTWLDIAQAFAGPPGAGREPAR